MKQYFNHFLILFLLATTSVFISFAGRPRFSDVMPVCRELPERIGDANAASVLFCQNEACMKSFIQTNAAMSKCVFCGSDADIVSLPEKRVLPKDTIINRKYYVSPQNSSFLVTVVTSGRQRTSIHRPEMCLEAQGYRLVGSRIVSVPVSGRRPLSVVLLDSRKSLSMTGGMQESFSCYAYWFVGGGHETSSHYERMIRSAWDNIVYGISYRWAYVSVMVQRPVDLPDEQTKQIMRIIPDLYSALMTGK